MKKIIAFILCTAVLTGCFPSKSGVVHSTAEDAVSALESKDNIILVVGKKECSACEEFRGVMDEIVKNYDIRITEVYMDDEEASVDEDTNQKSYPEYEKLEQYIGVIAGTPTVFFIEDGVIKGMFTGSVSYDTFKDKIEKYGFLPAAEE